MADNKKKLATFVEVDDNTPILKLGVLDQLRVIINKLTQDDARELEYDDSFAIQEATLMANLSDFIYKATGPIREGRHTSVTMSISSDFDSVLDEVIQSSSVSKYYKAKIRRPDVQPGVRHKILVRLEVK